MVACNEITTEAERIKNLFDKCYNLKSKDLKDMVELIESVNSCSNGSFSLKTINGESLFGNGDIIINEGTSDQTAIIPGSGVTITGDGSQASPYVISSQYQAPDGSETKINQGANISISGNGTISNPYVINANFPAQQAQVNADWSATSGPAQILNKPLIPNAQVNADWNALSGPALILNKPATLNANLSYTPTEFGGTISSSSGTGADIPLVTPDFPGLISQDQLDEILFDTDNIKIEIPIDIPENKTNEEFAIKINELAAFIISNNQIPTFKSIDVSAENPTIYYVEILGRGAGEYGEGGYQLLGSDLRVTSFPLSSGSIEDNDTTQKINLGSMSLDVVSAINIQAPPISIQGIEDGYCIISGTFEGYYEEWLWVGDAGIYGNGGLQATANDLRRLSAPSIPNASPIISGIVKVDTLVSEPTVYIKETTDSLLSQKVSKSGIENSLPILDNLGQQVGAIESKNERASLAGVTGALIEGPSTLISSLNGFTDYLVGIGLDGQLIPVKKELSGYAPTSTYSTPQNILANTPTKLGALITTTQSLTSPTLQWSVNISNTSNQTNTVRLRLGINNVANGSYVNYIIPRLTSLVITGASPYSPTVASGTEVSAYLDSTHVCTVNSVTIKLDSGVSALTVDQTIIDGSTNPVSGNAVFDGLALKQNAILGTNNYLTKFGSGGVVPSQIFDNGTNTGIGTPTPLAKFNIDKPNQTYNSALPTAGLLISDDIVGGTQRSIELGTDTNNGIGYLQARSVLSGTWYNLAINPNGGNVLVNTTTDNLQGVIQANGNITAFPATQSNQVVVKSQLDAIDDSQIEISTNSNTLDAWNKKTVLFTANCTITVPSTLLGSYGFVFRTLAGVTVTWAITAPFTWETTPTTTLEKTTGNFMRRGSTNTILLDF